MFEIHRKHEEQNHRRIGDLIRTPCTSTVSAGCFGELCVEFYTQEVSKMVFVGFQDSVSAQTCFCCSECSRVPLQFAIRVSRAAKLQYNWVMCRILHTRDVKTRFSWVFRCFWEFCEHQNIFFLLPMFPSCFE